MKFFRVFADNFYAHELLHFLSGLVMFFALFKMFGQVKYGIIAFLVSLLVDADHYFESFIVNKFNIQKIFNDNPHVYWKKLGKMTIFLHSWEILPLILVLGKLANHYPLAIAFVFPAALHYFIDNFIYSGFRKMPVFQYFLIYRICHRFDLKKACTKNE